MASYTESAEVLLEATGLDPNQDTVEHLLIFIEALRIYQVRSEQYGDIWKKAGAVEMYYNAFRKSRRIWNVITQQGNKITIEDDALDVLNYVIFGMRCARMGSM